MDEFENGSKQGALFDLGEWWEDEWQGMPEFVQRDQSPFKEVVVKFRNKEDMAEFMNILNQRFTMQTTSIWHPKLEHRNKKGLRYVNAEFGKRTNPKYPVYVISKGRWELRPTAKALERLGVPYHIVVEPQEYDDYAAVIDPSKILVLPFSNLGKGSIPARNWVWEHSVSTGSERHWLMDDNIYSFWRLNRNSHIQVASGTIFRVIEDFTDRYENVVISGTHNLAFVRQTENVPPFYLNTRVYSCTLIKNDIPYRWRGIYNEDTDLCLRVLKDGYCTVLFNAFTMDKATTMEMKGGNTDELYVDDGRLKMAESLKEQHPDVTDVVFKWGRWQHHVDYKPFKRNKLIRRREPIVPEGVDDYGMILKNAEKEEKETVDPKRDNVTHPGEEHQIGIAR